MIQPGAAIVTQLLSSNYAVEQSELTFKSWFQPVAVAKYRKEIITRCDTRLRQECNTTMVEVPKEVCLERPHNECFEDFE